MEAGLACLGFASFELVGLQYLAAPNKIPEYKSVVKRSDSGPDLLLITVLGHWTAARQPAGLVGLTLRLFAVDCCLAGCRVGHRHGLATGPHRPSSRRGGSGMASSGCARRGKAGSAPSPRATMRLSTWRGGLVAARPVRPVPASLGSSQQLSSGATAHIVPKIHTVYHTTAAVFASK